jgi:hypothetical protein
VVEQASTTTVIVGALVVAVLTAALVSAFVARRTRTALVLRAG